MAKKKVRKKVKKTLEEETKPKLSDAFPDEPQNEYGGMEMGNFKKNLGCGG